MNKHSLSTGTISESLKIGWKEEKKRLPPSQEPWSSGRDKQVKTMSTYSIVCSRLERNLARNLRVIYSIFREGIREDFIEKATLDNGYGRLLWNSDR